MTQYIGLFAGFLTSISLLPQAIKVFKTKSTHDISVLWTILLTVGMLLWLIYGIILHDVPLIFANVSGGLLSSAVLVGKIIYK